MGYDTYLVIDTGDRRPATVHYCGNVSDMWSKALDVAGYKPLEGLSGYYAIPLIEKALAHICDPVNAVEYEAMGNVESTREYLRNILAGCRAHPKAKLYFST